VSRVVPRGHVTACLMKVAVVANHWGFLLGLSVKCRAGRWKHRKRHNHVWTEVRLRVWDVRALLVHSFRHIQNQKYS